MTTLERPQEHLRHAAAPVDHRPSRGWFAMAVVAVLALVVGAFAGWSLRGDGSADLVLAGDGDLSARQELIVDFIRDYEQAWIDGDAETIVSMYAAGGRFIGFDTVYRADDGSLADFVDDGWAIDIHWPVLVDGNEVVSFHDWGGSTYVNTMRFTTAGELLLVAHVVDS